MKKYSVYFLVFTFLLTLVCSYSCKPELNIGKAITAQWKPTDIYSTNQLPDTINIVLDVTISMKGFIQDTKKSDKNYVSESYRSMILGLNSAFSGTKTHVNYYALNTKLTKICDSNHYDQTAYFLYPKSYSDLKCDFSCIDTILTKNSAILLLTDLQYNGSTKLLSRVPQFQNYIKNDSYFVLYNKAMGYDGDICYPVNYYYKGNRPYYLILISKNSSTYSLMNKSLVQAFKPDKTLPFIQNTLSKVKQEKLDGNIGYEGSQPLSEYCLVLRRKNNVNLSRNMSITNPIFEAWNNVDAKNDFTVSMFTTIGTSNDKPFMTLSDETKTLLKTNSLQGEKLDITVKTTAPLKKNTLLRMSYQPQNLPNWVTITSCREEDNIKYIASHTLNLHEFLKNIIASEATPFEITSGYIFIE